MLQAVESAGTPSYVGLFPSSDPPDAPKDAWGNLEIGASEPGFSFTGREWDPEIGLYYYRARYYDPKTHRFISEDPIGLAGGLNLYEYASGNPTTLTDPSGLDPRHALGTLGEKMAKYQLQREGYSIVLSAARKAVNQGGFDMIAVKGNEVLVIDNKALLSRRTVSSATSLAENLQANVRSAIAELGKQLERQGLSAAERATIRTAMDSLETGAYKLVVTGCGGIAGKVGPRLAGLGIVFKQLGKAAGAALFVATELYFAEDVGGFLSDVPLTNEEMDLYEKWQAGENIFEQ